MGPRLPAWSLLAVLALTAALAAPGLLAQFERSRQIEQVLAGKSVAERSRVVDQPAFSVAERIAQATPPDACVTISAYAGPAAIDYYNARLDYLLYPRRVRVTAAIEPPPDDCEYLAVFRDTEQNLSAEPFAGRWDETALASIVSEAETVAEGPVRIYLLP